MDFITDLPVSNNFNCIFTVVDRLTKMAHFIPTTTTCSAPEVARLFMQHIFKLHGLPKSIISDRDPRFTSKFWKELMRLLDVSLKLSSAFHPQTDGQTERTHRILEEILRNYVNFSQSNWSEKIHLVEFAYNNSDQDSTGFSPFFLNYGFHPHTSLSLSLDNSMESPVEAVDTFIKFMAQSLEDAKSNLIKAQTLQMDNANRSRGPDPEFKIGDQVLLSAQNLSSTNIGSAGARKLGPKWVGPFKIIRVISPVTFELDLPAAWSVHPVFHAHVLRPFKSPSSSLQTVRPQPVQVQGAPEWEVEDILAHRTRSKKKQYLVQWKGFPVHECTWETESNLAHAAIPLQRYLDSLQRTQNF